MEEMRLLRLRPDLTMIAEELNACGISCRVAGEAQDRNIRGVRLFSGTAALREDMLYILRPEDLGKFPRDEYAYLCTVPASGTATHLYCPDGDPDRLLDFLLELFSRLQQMEMDMDELVYQNANIQAFCEAGAVMLENPICVHDDWFIMIAMTRELPEVMSPDYIMSSNRAFVPQAVIEDFKFDSEYLETYTYHSAQFWNYVPGDISCLYVNMWEGEVYRGRLLVVERNRPFRRLDYLIAEVLTQRATILLRQKRMGEETAYRSMDDIVYDLLRNVPVSPKESGQFLSMMGWSKQDRLLCIRLHAQQTGVTPVTEHMLHSDLFRAFPGSYIMFAGSQQCVIWNYEREKDKRKSALLHRLAPLCRDYCQYAGISSPVGGIGELHLAYHLAGIAMDRLFQLRDHRWILSFGDCALDHMLHNQQPPLQPGHLQSPDLLMLRQYDKEKGTQYFETLRTYLLMERDIPRTSRALIIHRTTLLYRLQKIQELTELDLDDPDVRLYLLLSLKILKDEQTGQDE